MKAKNFRSLQSVFLGLGLLAFTPSVNPTTAGKAEQPLPKFAATLKP